MDRLTIYKDEVLSEVLLNFENALEIYDRLSQYEDTGLTPAEIAGLEQARQEGRLAIVPEMDISQMNDVLEPIKLKSALDSELMKLEFRKENKPKDVSILDYTIIYALHKCLTLAAAEDALKKE